MIARIWSGVTSADRADEYNDYIEKTGVPALTQTRGNHGVYVLKRLSGDEAHFTVVSLWDSLKEIEAFAGEDISRARMYPDDEDFLIRYDTKVVHHEVLGFHVGPADASLLKGHGPD
ncbi:MAG: antibiotic biosynthesis monooxygenase [Candidatus Zixiibacteriota bacterium]|nr:MAG: antibiotic biosynthesis monooxygenase [candidate division Zixibacteria bacterium]